MIEIDPKDVQRRPRSPIKPAKVEPDAKRYQRKSKHPKRTLWVVIAGALLAGMSQIGCQKACITSPSQTFLPVGREIVGPYVWTTVASPIGQVPRTLEREWRVSESRWREAWKADAWRIVENLEQPWSRGQFSVEHEKGQSFWTFRWVQEALAAHSIVSEVLQFQLPEVVPGSLSWADRRGEWSVIPTSSGSVFMPRGLPWWLSWNNLLWVVAQLPKQRAPGLWVSAQGVVTLELDHRDNRPMGNFRPAGHSDPLGRRKPGEKSITTWRLYFAQPRPDLPEKFPGGARAALVVTDHADQGSFAKTRALAQAFTSRGLAMTKTIFGARTSGYAKQFDDPRFLGVLETMQAAGSEVGLHSWTGGSDTTAVLDQGIQKFRQYFRGKTWIDHQPDTNVEALSHEGLNARSAYASREAIEQGHFQFVWNAKDLALGRHPLNLLRPEEPTERTAVVFQDPALGALTAFVTQWAYWTPAEWDRRFSPANIENLIRDRGLWMGHTYLDTFQEHGPHQSVSLLVRTSPGAYAMHPIFLGVLDRWQNAQRLSQLTVTTVEALLSKWLENEKTFPTPSPSVKVGTWIFPSESSP